MLSRAQVESLAADPGAWTLEAIRAAIAGCDYERAAACVLARVRAGLTCPAELAAEILVGIRAPGTALALIAVGSGDRAAALLAALAGRRFSRGPEAREIEVIALFAAAQLGAGREALIPEVRRLARLRLQLPGYALLGEVAATLDNPNIALVARHVAAIRARMGAEIVDVARAHIARTTDEVFASLPALVEGPRVVSGFTVRTGPRPGRNDACPCGSGQKYKRCCADKEATIAPSPIAGLSWDDYVTTAADRMTADDIGALSLRDLARVDATRLDRLPLLRALHRFGAEHEWPHVARLLEALARLPPTSAARSTTFGTRRSAMRSMPVRATSRAISSRGCHRRTTPTCTASSSTSRSALRARSIDWSPRPTRRSATTWAGATSTSRSRSCGRRRHSGSSSRAGVCVPTGRSTAGRSSR